MRFGINSFLLTSGFTHDDLAMIGQFKAWGADIIELAVHEPERIDPAVVRRALEAQGMTNVPVCGIFPPERDLRGTAGQQQTSLDYVSRLIDLAAALGSTIVAGPLYSSVGRCNLHTDAEKERQSDLVARNLAKLCTKAEQSGVILAMEVLNRFETDFINTLEQASAMIDRVGSPALKIHADTFHMNIEEGNPAAAVRAAGNRLGHFHASGSHRGIPGTGHVDWKGIFGALKAIHYGGDVVIEAFSADNDTIARAVSIWVRRFDTPEQLAREGLGFLRNAWEQA